MAELKKASQLTEPEAIALLRTKFDAQGYALFPQVPDGTGARQRRTADAIMMSLWPSRGLHLFGIEYKRTVADWRRELKDPSKADSIGKYCDYWYMLAPKGVIDILEVPPAWGLWEIDDRHRLLRTREAPQNEHKVPVDLVFLAGLVRAAQNAFSSEATIKAIRSEQYRRGFEDGSKDARYTRDQKLRQLEKLRESLDDFEKASGIKIDSWTGGDYLGKEVREGLKLLSQPSHHISNAKHIASMASNLHDAAVALEETLTAQTS